MIMKISKSGCFGFATLSLFGAGLHAGGRPTAANPITTALSLPTQFEPNRGQAPREFEYMAQGFGYSLGIAAGRAELMLGGRPGTTPSAVWLNFVGANRKSQPQPVDAQRHTSNYFVGNVGVTNVPGYGKLRYNDLWPGVGVVYYGSSQKLEYDFTVAPGADPNAIKIQFEGARSVKLSADGDVVVDTGSAQIIQRRAVAYQLEGESRVTVAADYRLRADGSIRFALGNFDRSKELVIDPVLVYGIGGYLNNQAQNSMAVATDYLGTNNFVVGSTIPLVQVSGQPATNGVYVVHIDNTGAIPSNSYFAAGLPDGNINGTGIDVDASGNIYVVGTTDAHNSFLGPNGLQVTSGGGLDAFLLKLTPALNAVPYWTYLGGAGDEKNIKVAVQGGTAYISGQTTSAGWPVTVTPAGQNGFVYAIDTTKAGAASKVYALVLGGSSTDAALGIAADFNSNVYVAGSTNSADFQPTTGAGYATGKSNSTTDGFLVKLNPAGQPIWNTFYQNAPISGVAQFTNRYAYVTGQTTGSIISTGNAYQPTGGPNHAFFARFDTSTSGGPALTYGTYLGGAVQDAGMAISVPHEGIGYTQNGLAYIGGWTTSSNFPILGVPQVQAAFNNGIKNGFLAYIDPTKVGAQSLLYSTLVGTTFPSVVTGVAASFAGEASLSVTAYDPNSGLEAGGFAFKVGSQIWNPTFFTSQQYLDLLDRASDQPGLNFWLNQLSTGGNTRASLAANFFTSAEFTNGGLNIIKYYIAVFRRDPDFTGFLFNYNSYIGGTPLTAILNQFLTSPEFQSTYGTLTNGDFVNLIYQNVLGRAPDPNGFNYYVGLLNSNQLSRAGVMVQFINSAEFSTAVRARAYANLLYMGFLRRGADPTGLNFWTNALANQANLPTVVNNFITSPEYVNRFM